MFPGGAGNHDRHISSVMSLFKFTLVISETWWQRFYSFFFPLAENRLITFSTTWKMFSVKIAE